MDKLDEKVFKIWKIVDLQEKDNICEITFKAFDYFPFVHLIVNYVLYIPTCNKLDTYWHLQACMWLTLHCLNYLIFNNKLNINRFCYFLQRLQKILLVSVLHVMAVLLFNHLKHGLFAFYWWKWISLQSGPFSPCLKINTSFEFLISKTCELLLQRCANENT